MSISSFCQLLGHFDWKQNTLLDPPMGIYVHLGPEPSVWSVRRVHLPARPTPSRLPIETGQVSQRELTRGRCRPFHAFFSSSWTFSPQSAAHTCKQIKCQAQMKTWSSVIGMDDSVHQVAAEGAAGPLNHVSTGKGFLVCKKTPKLTWLQLTLLTLL